ncbi:hypothetical protein BST99_04985 [Aureicoccus marinus]|uniref:histidine kinase n=1 Tax=Aureicoccus marinus TaxID=754435 RepID=A0A2S7T5G1_9FLAO|nr:hypothetical protein BST99_04985 [Aureicoccus marinus]
MYGELYTSTQKASPFHLNRLSDFKEQNDKRSFVYLDFAVSQAYLDFELLNPNTQSTTYTLSFSYPFIEDVRVYKRKRNTLKEIGFLGLTSGHSPNGRSWNTQITLAPHERANFYVVFTKSEGKPLATDMNLHTKGRFDQLSALQNTLIGSYFGLTLISILFALFIFYATQYSNALLYALYLISLGVYMAAYLGYINLIIPASNLDNGRLLYVLAIEFSTLIFVLFAQELLQAKKYLPQLKRVVEIIIGVQVALRLVFHFITPSLYEAQVALFMKFWYATILFLVCAVIAEIVVYLRYNKKVGVYFAISYLFMTLASVFMLLHHSFGLVKVTFFGLSQILFASVLEILFLSITLSLIIRQIYSDRNALAQKLLVQQQKFLNAYVQGQEEERRRLGAELHDNIGSRVSNIRRLFSTKPNKKDVEKELDQVCTEIREMAHALTPADIQLVGLAGVLEDLFQEVEETEGLKMQFNTYQFPEDLDEEKATHLYRIVQELVQNVIKHAKASTVSMQLFGHDESLTLSFEDDGQGLSATDSGEGIGLQNIRSRVDQLKGQFCWTPVHKTALQSWSLFPLNIPEFWY